MITEDELDMWIKAYTQKNKEKESKTDPSSKSNKRKPSSGKSDPSKQPPPLPPPPKGMGFDDDIASIAGSAKQLNAKTDKASADPAASQSNMHRQLKRKHVKDKVQELILTALKPYKAQKLITDKVIQKLQMLYASN